MDDLFQVSPQADFLICLKGHLNGGMPLPSGREGFVAMLQGHASDDPTLLDGLKALATDRITDPTDLTAALEATDTATIFDLIFPVY